MKKVVLLLLIIFSTTNLVAQQYADHTVASGETLESIAKQYGITASELKKMNAGVDDYIFAGMVLYVPKDAARETAAQTQPAVSDLKDVIYLTDGSELVSKVLNVTSTEVTFEQYDKDEPYFITKSQVAKIKFEDGKVTDFTKRPAQKPVSKPKSRRR